MRRPSLPPDARDALVGAAFWLAAGPPLVAVTAVYVALLAWVAWRAICLVWGF